jgi:hypothetical protein
MGFLSFFLFVSFLLLSLIISCLFLVASSLLLFSLVQKLTSDEETQSKERQAIRVKTEEVRSALEQVKSRDGLHAALMKAASSKKLSGIKGKLGELGVIDEKYDVAISTGKLEREKDCEAVCICVLVLSPHSLCLLILLSPPLIFFL